MSYDEYSNSYPPPPPPSSPPNGYEQEPPRSKRGGGMTVLIVLLVVGGACVLLCCGGGGAFFWFGSNVFSEQVRNELRDNPVIAERIGEIRSMKVDWTKSAAAEGEDVYVFNIEGTKGQIRKSVV